MLPVGRVESDSFSLDEDVIVAKLGKRTVSVNVAFVAFDDDGFHLDSVWVKGDDWKLDFVLYFGSARLKGC